MDASCKVGDTEMGISEVALMRKFDLQHRAPCESDHDYTDAPNFSNDCLSEFKKTAISYISGSAGRITARNLLCSECVGNIYISRKLAYIKTLGGGRKITNHH